MTDLTNELAALRTAAPEHLVERVLVSAGLGDRYVTRPSPLGNVFVAFNERGVCVVDLAADPADFEEKHAQRTGRRAYPAADEPSFLTRRLEKAIAEGRPGSLPVDLGALTEFQRLVLLKAAEIPRGQVRPYAWVAREIGRPRAVRAVGTALANNPVPLIVPCHRVVRSDGTFGKYSLGEDANKQLLLELEGVGVEEFGEQARRGVRYTGSRTTKIFCHPTCSHARRTRAENAVEFMDEQGAREAGYRPCMVCRPAEPAA